MILLGFLFDGGLDQWSYAIAADVVAAGAEFVRFRPDDVDLATRTIVGEFWENGQWVKRRCRYPDAIRNFELAREKDRILKCVPYTLGFPIRKGDQLALLRRTHDTAWLIPETLPVNSNCDIVGKIELWGAGVLKPSRGRLGQGICYIRKQGSTFEVEENGVWHNMNREQLVREVARFSNKNARKYILQQFAAGKGPAGRYFNVRIIVLKSGDGDWHACNVPISLLARKGTVVANRELGAKNIALEPFLTTRYGVHAPHVLDQLFGAAVLVARVLDDAGNGGAEEIALDMAVDENGKPWLHEANWRGGFWLFEEDIGLYRHGGRNMLRYALNHRGGGDLDRANAVRISAAARTSQSLPRMASTASVRLGLEIVRRSDETAALVAEAICIGISYLAVSPASSFIEAQRRVGIGIDAVKDQMHSRMATGVISRGGFCVHDADDVRPFQSALQEDLMLTGLIDADELDRGASLNAKFLQWTINANQRDLGVGRLDIFLVEGLEQSLRNRPDWRKYWRSAAYVLSDAVSEGRIQEWGFVLEEKKLNLESWAKPCELIDEVNALGILAPKYMMIRLDNGCDFQRIVDISELAKNHKLTIIFLLPEPRLRRKEWDKKHQSLPGEILEKSIKQLSCDSIILVPVTRVTDLVELQQRLKNTNNHNLLYSGKLAESVTDEKMVDDPANKARCEALQKFASFDHRQYFRFFVDGRFHKKYRGYSGYEENEKGSVQGMINAYCYILDHFDLSDGLKSTYLRNLHTVCMSNVSTSNRKTTPGDLRFLEAGINFYAGNSTVDSVQEILEQRYGDGSLFFHTPDLERPAECFTAKEILEVLNDRRRLRFRPWYPVLSQEQKAALVGQRTLDAYYKVKHLIQSGFANRVDRIVMRYNNEIIHAQSSFDKLISISRIVRDLEILHPFPDGNGRMLVAALMNHLLLYNGFLPAILWDPNIDLELSVREFAEEIRKGIENTEILLANPRTALYGYSIDEASAAEISKFENLAKGLLTLLGPYSDKTASKSVETLTPTVGVTIYLNPDRLAKVTKGFWINANTRTLDCLRFQSVNITPENDGTKQLIFCRALKQWRTDGRDPIVEIEKVVGTGSAVVVDDLSIARSLSVPVLYVENVDDALYAVGREAREAVGCKSIAIAGSVGKTTAKSMLLLCLSGQGDIHATSDNGNKTPHIMASLANLRLTDNIELCEIDVGARAKVSRHRSNAVVPDICFFSSLGPVHYRDDQSLEQVVEAHAAVTDGMKRCGLCLVDSASMYADLLALNISERNSLAVQRYGMRKDDHGRIIKAIFDRDCYAWRVKVDILGKYHDFYVPGVHDYLPIMATGVLLATANLGFDIASIAAPLSTFKPAKTSARLDFIERYGKRIYLYDYSQHGGIEEAVSALDDIKRTKSDGRLVGVVGDMYGDRADNWTRSQNNKLIELLESSEITHLYLFGKVMNEFRGRLSSNFAICREFELSDEAISQIISDLDEGGNLFIFGRVGLELWVLADKIRQLGYATRLA